jgi:hypothetical protein
VCCIVFRPHTTIEVVLPSTQEDRVTPGIRGKEGTQEIGVNLTRKQTSKVLPGLQDMPLYLLHPPQIQTNR